MLKNILEIQTLNKNVYGNKHFLFAPKSFIYLINDTTDRAETDVIEIEKQSKE